MNEKDKYCTPEQAEKLFKLAGLNTERYWYTLGNGVYELHVELIKVTKDSRAIPALDIPEIMSILPIEIKQGDKIFYFRITKNEVKERKYEVAYINVNSRPLGQFQGEHLAHVLMDLLLWCIDNGHLKVEDVKL